MDTDYLSEAKEWIDVSNADRDDQVGQRFAQVAIACALIALIERLDKLADYEQHVLGVFNLAEQ